MSDRSDALIEAFKQTRAEILKRMDHREFILRTYFVASISFIGGSLFGVGSEETNPAILYSVMPISSLAVATYLYYQVKSIHGLADFIRHELEPAIEAEIGGPFMHYDRANKSRSFNFLRTFSSQVVTFSAVHVMSAISLGFAWVSAVGRGEFFVVSIATTAAVVAFLITVMSKWHRWSY